MSDESDEIVKEVESQELSTSANSDVELGLNTTRGLFVLIAAAALLVFPFAIRPSNRFFVSFFIVAPLLVVVACVWFRTSFVNGLIWFAICGVIIGFLVPPRRHVPEAARRTVCLNNIRQLVLAAHNYESRNLAFPPPFTVDEEGAPLHSWRVQLLPYLDEGELYEDLDLSKPWDHPDNIKHAHRMPELFRCPSDRRKRNSPGDEVMTSYVAVISDGTVWSPTAGGCTFHKITDGSSNTIMVVESDAHRVHWMSPSDMIFDEIFSGRRDDETNLFTSHHPGGFQVGMADGSARYVSGEVPVKELKAALLINDGKSGRLD
jgi:hypothetical protein